MWVEMTPGKLFHSISLQGTIINAIMHILQSVSVEVFEPLFLDCNSRSVIFFDLGARGIPIFHLELLIQDIIARLVQDQFNMYGIWRPPFARTASKQRQTTDQRTAVVPQFVSLMYHQLLAPGS